MDIFDTNVKQISGPINVIRLEGKIHGIIKVLYLFLDIHENVYYQTECVNVFSKDLNKYLAENFYKLNGMRTTFDFFMEIRPTSIVPTPDIGVQYLSYKKNYISQVLKFFSSVFTYDKEKDTVKISDTFKNVRLHYLDIRDYFKYHIMDLLDVILSTSFEFMHNTYINPERLMYIIKELIIVKEELDNTIAILNSEPVSKKQVNPVSRQLNNDKIPVIKQYKGFDPDTIKKLVNKMTNSYNHKDIKKVLVSYFDKYVNDLKKLSKEIEDTAEIFVKYSKYFNDNAGKLMRISDGEYNYGITGSTVRNIIVDIINRCDDLSLLCIKTFARITDIYFLRRFLDKDYITNGIVYSGAAHSEIYVKILLADFDFEITHIAYSSISNLDMLNKQIKMSAQNNEDITFMINPPYLYQCSDVTNFPENFL